MQHIGQLPGAARNIAFNGVRQRVDAGCGFQRWRHAGHHLRIDDRHLWNIVRIDADEFTAFFFVGNDIVDGDFRCGACGSGDRDQRDAGITRRGETFKAAHVRKLRVIDNYADRFAGILRRTAADGDKIVRLSALKYLDAALHHGNGGVRHYLVVERPVKLMRIHQVSDALHRASGNQRFIGND